MRNWESDTLVMFARVIRITSDVVAFSFELFGLE